MTVLPLSSWWSYPSFAPPLRVIAWLLHYASPYWSSTWCYTLRCHWIIHSHSLICVASTLNSHRFISDVSKPVFDPYFHDLPRPEFNTTMRDRIIQQFFIAHKVALFPVCSSDLSPIEHRTHVVDDWQTTGPVCTIRCYDRWTLATRGSSIYRHTPRTLPKIHSLNAEVCSCSHCHPLRNHKILISSCSASLT